MNYLSDFLKKKDVTKSKIYEQLESTKEEALFLKAITKHYIKGDEEVVVVDLLIQLYGSDNFTYLHKLTMVKKILEMGWLTQQFFQSIKIGEQSLMELLNTPITLSPSFLQLLENGNLNMHLPAIKAYEDHLEYLQDQFSRIDLYQKMSEARGNFHKNSLNISRLSNKLKLLESCIQERIKKSKNSITVENFFKDNKLDKKEEIIFLALLKEEYSAGKSNLREMNTLIELISNDEYDRIKNRALLEDGSKLLNENIIDYDEVLNPFGGISRAFFIFDEILQAIIHPQKKKRAQRLKLDIAIKEQNIFELISPKTTLEDVVLHPKTLNTLENILKQLDKTVNARLIKWGVKEKKSGMNARIILYGPPGTGKTLTAYSMAKSLKKQILNFDCSKILSMYVGESEKNVRKIFDTYVELASKTKSEPLLLLNEADQFLSSRILASGNSADQMHNQMQNIFLEQIEKFNGILIATTNLLDNIDSAFSRRFNYKLEFSRPTLTQRKNLWQLHLPKQAPYEEKFNINELIKYDLSGGQISLIIKNTAYIVATQKNPCFRVSDFLLEIDKERSSNFDKEKKLGFINS